jgi:hypothetical protein
MNLKIYRKLLVLVVLSIGLFAASSFTANRVAAIPCCYVCDVILNMCLNACGGPTTGERTCIESCYADDDICRVENCSHCPQ